VNQIRKGFATVRPQRERTPLHEWGFTSIETTAAGGATDCEFSLRAELATLAQGVGCAFDAVKRRYAATVPEVENPEKMKVLSIG
jgi:hypothetical protein